MSDYSFVREYSIPRLIFEIADIQYLDANRLFKPFNLTLEQAYLLYCLQKKDNVSQKDLSEYTLKDQANTTRILKRLAEKKLVKIVNAKKDKRVNIVSLTKDAKDLLRKLLPYMEAAHKNYNELFSKEEIDRLKEMLYNYLNAYKENMAINQWRKEVDK